MNDWLVLALLCSGVLNVLLILYALDRRKHPPCKPKRKRIG